MTIDYLRFIVKLSIDYDFKIINRYDPNRVLFINDRYCDKY